MGVVTWADNLCSRRSRSSLSRCWFRTRIKCFIIFLVLFLRCFGLFFFPCLLCLWGCARAKVPAFPAQLSQFQKSWRGESQSCAERAQTLHTLCIGNEVWVVIQNPKKGLSVSVFVVSRLLSYKTQSHLVSFSPSSFVPLPLHLCVYVEKSRWSERSTRRFPSLSSENWWCSDVFWSSFFFFFPKWSELSHMTFSGFWNVWVCVRACVCSCARKCVGVCRIWVSVSSCLWDEEQKRW